MAVFAIVSFRAFPTAKIEAALQSNFADKFILVDEGHWLLNDPNGTAQSVSEKLGLLTDSGGVAVVYNIGGYFGRAPNHVWEWLSANFGARL